MPPTTSPHSSAAPGFRGTLAGLLRPRPTPREWLNTLVWGGVIFGGFGTITALWHNPLFMRMTPVYIWDYLILALEALLLGFYLGLESGSCAVKPASIGGVLAFLGFGCSVCNKILLLIFGSGFLLAYFEPIKHPLGALGLGVLGWALHKKLRLRADLHGGMSGNSGQQGTLAGRLPDDLPNGSA